MKRILSLLGIIAITAAATINAQQVTVTLNKLYTDSMNFTLPDKEIKQKMPLLKIANPKWDFTAKLKGIVKRIAAEDYDNNVFTVNLHYAGVGIAIEINSCDILDMNDAEFYGDLYVDRRHFVLLEDDDNKDLLKTYFKKERGKEAKFERTFEKVVDLVTSLPTSYNAKYNERQRSIQINQFIVNSIDKLNTKPQQLQDPQQEQNIDDIDAFKIDVELLNE